MTATASVVIPAHNEAAVIDRTLRALLDGARSGEFDVIVVANACSDRTVEVAERAGIRVLATGEAGKSNALRLGDRACTTFPRVYLDADVAVTADDLRLLVSALAAPGVLACAPAPSWELSGVTWLARRVHRVHDALMKPSRALAGVGVYALSEVGHDRVFPIPDIVSDDEWVHRSFAVHERVVVAQARSVVRPARTVSAHLRRRVRVRLGNRELEGLGLPAAQGRLRLGSLAGLLTSSDITALDAGCYLAVLAADRTMTRLRFRSAELVWSADASTRAPVAGAN